MCGLVAIAGQIKEQKHLDMFNTMLHLSTLRGEDSTGVASVNNQNEYDLFKAVGPAINHIGYKRYNSVVSIWNSVLLGHNRKATMGKISVNNAHPFLFGNTLGMHNGTIPHFEKNRWEGPKSRFDTDSEALIYGLHKNQNKWFDYKVEGAWAVVWFDFTKRELNIARNDERTLWYALSKDNKHVFIASEALTITYASWRCGVPVGTVKSLEALTHQKFHIPDNEKDEITLLAEAIKLPGYMTKEEKEALAKKKAEEEERNKNKWRENWTGYERGNYGESYYPKSDLVLPPPSKTLTALKEEIEEEKEDDKIKGDSKSKYHDHIGAPLTEGEFKKITNCRCCMCSSNITPNEDYKWLNKSEVLCESCVKDIKIGLKGKSNEIYDTVKSVYPNFVFSLDEIKPNSKTLVM